MSEKSMNPTLWGIMLAMLGIILGALHDLFFYSALASSFLWQLADILRLTGAILIALGIYQSTKLQQK